MTNYAQHLNPQNTPQSEPVDPRQVKNSAGGYTFEVTPWQRLDRWLILGAEGGTYYASERKLTLENVEAIRACLALDGPRTVAAIVAVSDAGRAPKNDPAVFALAIAAADPNAETRAAALAALPKVCRIGTHLFQFAETVNQLRGWGPGLQKAVARWYTERSHASLLNQLTKYRSRATGGGRSWSHADLLRLSHARATDEFQQAAFRWAVGQSTQERVVAAKKGSELPARSYAAVAPLEHLEAFDELKSADAARTIVLIRQHGFTHEMIATEHKNVPEVWEALLEKMPMTALIRNLAKMTQVGLLKPLSAAAAAVANRLNDAGDLVASRVHPIAVLSALRTYQQGRGERGSLTWEPVGTIVDALDDAFYLAFGSVVPSGKRHLIALDVSGSMAMCNVAGVPGLTPREASAAMALVTMRTEPAHHAVGFTGNNGHGTTELRPLPISPKMRLGDVVKAVSNIPFGRTDCALPMLYAAGAKLDVDAFSIWTDNETWCGSVHPHVALQSYREKSGLSSTLAIVACTATPFSIADPSDPRQLDVVGFDTATPNLLASHARGWQ